MDGDEKVWSRDDCFPLDRPGRESFEEESDARDWPLRPFGKGGGGIALRSKSAMMRFSGVSISW
jgi:hypothetical protein